MSISVWFLMALCMCGMYVHDQVVLSATVNEDAASWLATTEKTDKKTWITSEKKKLTEILFLLDVTSLQVKNTLAGKKIKVKYRLPISWSWLKNVLQNGKSEMTYETTREDIVPAKYMWSVKEVKGG